MEHKFFVFLKIAQMRMARSRHGWGFVEIPQILTISEIEGGVGISQNIPIQSQPHPSKNTQKQKPKPKNASPQKSGAYLLITRFN